MKTPRTDSVQWALHGGLALLALLTVLPLVIMTAMSAKDLGQLTLSFWAWPSPIRWENYAFGLKVTLHYLGNSLLVSGAVCVLTLVCAGLAAYAFSRFRFRGRQGLFGALLLALMLPNALLLVPLFLLCRELGLLDTPWALVLPQAAGALPLAILLLRTSFDGLSRELFDAARIDGASELRVLWHVVVPLSLPVFSTVAILNLLASWNNYIWPQLAVQTESLRTLPLGLAFLVFEYDLKFQPGRVMAAYLMSSLPVLILFLFMTRPFVKGLTSGALKE
ncbi:MAG: carbohydrate ABC transporter permease [Opitutaceae bacterium]|nr:carbohydrate ABC transporter permease [Opitutaceae bacterium]